MYRKGMVQPVLYVKIGVASIFLALGSIGIAVVVAAAVQAYELVNTATNEIAVYSDLMQAYKELVN